MAYNRTNWQDLPNQTTPINATNLNKIEQGIYDATYVNGVNVGSSVDSNYRVNILKSKNMLDPTNIISGIYSVSNGNYVSDNNAKCTRNKIAIDNTKNYVLSATSSNTSSGIYVLYYDASENYLGNSYASFSTGYIVLNAYTNYSQAKFVNFRFDAIDITNVMFEEGSSKTTYEAYSRSIYVDNEEIYSKDNLEQYSTSEIKIGTWIDGKPLYRKTISGTTTGETNNILNIITGYNEVIKYNGTFKTPSGYITELPEYTNASNYIYFVLNTSNNVGILSIPSGFIGGTYNIVIEYTKTTDTATRSLNAIEQTRSIPTESTEDDER